MAIVTVENESLPSFDHGRKSGITTSAVQLIATATPVKKGVYIKSPAANTADLYIGNSDVTTDAADATDGIPISPGDPPLFVEVNDVSKVYAKAASGTQKLFMLWF